MSRKWLRLPVLATIAVMLAACAGTTAPTPGPTKAPATAAAPTTAPTGAPATAAASVAPATTGTATGGPATVAPQTAEPTTEATTAPGPSGTPLPTPVIIAPESVAPGVKLIRWYCCLGTGDDPKQVKIEKRVIEDFNASHSDIQIQGEFVLYAQAYDTLATEIAGGNPPDIVGPVGFGGANAFSGHWLDLQPLIESDALRHEPVGIVGGRLLQGRRRAGGPALRDLSRRAVLPARRFSGDRHK